MDGRRRSPHADDPSCGGGGANSSMTPQESEATEGSSPSAPPTSAHHSGQPGRSIFVDGDSSDGLTIGAASSFARGPDEGEDPKITDKTAAPFILGPRRLGSPMGASDSDSDDDRDSWVGFSDRTGGGASTSMSSPDAYDYRAFFGDPLSEINAQDLRLAWKHSLRTAQNKNFLCPQILNLAMILGHSFWRQEEKTSQNGTITIHEKKPLSDLPAECVYQDMKDKSNMLLANYSEYRKVSGDGNCFYRAFIYSYLEQLVNVSHDEELRLLVALEPMLGKFQRLHWPDSYSDSHNAFVGLILECMEQKQTLAVSDYENWLYEKSQNEQKFAEIISYLRLLTAIEICTEAEKFGPYIPQLDPENPDVWCRENVIPMGEEAEQFHLTALTDVLHVPLQVVNVDISGTVEPNTHIIHESALPFVPSVTLLYRPGHYDILY